MSILIALINVRDTISTHISSFVISTLWRDLKTTFSKTEDLSTPFAIPPAIAVPQFRALSYSTLRDYSVMIEMKKILQ